LSGFPVAEKSPEGEIPEMPDLDLNDDMLKLVRYRILFVKRDYEVAFPHSDVLVYDNINSGAFAAWKVAEFIEKLRTTPVPEKWGGGHNPRKCPRYPCHAWWCKSSCSWLIGKLDDDDYKYLRVSYEIADRYPRQSLEYEEDHLKVLRQIRDRIPALGLDREGPDCGDSKRDCRKDEHHGHDCGCDVCSRHEGRRECGPEEPACDPAPIKVHG
jgi:hypothetical protein